MLDIHLECMEGMGYGSRRIGTEGEERAVSWNSKVSELRETENKFTTLHNILYKNS